MSVSTAGFCDSIGGYHRKFFFSYVNVFLIVDLLIRKFLVMGALVINYTLCIAF